MLKYRRQNAQWDITDNPVIAESWLKHGEVVEVLEYGQVIKIWAELSSPTARSK